MAEKKSWYEDREEFAEARHHMQHVVGALGKLARAYIQEHPEKVESIVLDHAVKAVTEILVIKAVKTGKKPVSTAEQLVIAENTLGPQALAELRKSITDKDGNLRDDEVTRTILALVIKAHAATTQKGKS